MIKKIIFLFLLFQYSTYGQGQHGFQVITNTENDFLGLNNKDENYTGSLKIELQFPDRHFKFLPFIRYKEVGSINIHRIGFGGIAYTPQHIELSEVINK